MPFLGPLKHPALFAVAGLALACAGCGINCDRDPDVAPVPWKGGVTENGPSGLVYDSSPNADEGPYLDFPPGRTYRFFHSLGGKARSIVTYFAFADRCGAGSRKVERSSIGVGNQATLETQTDPTYFDVRNDTCSDVCLRVIARDPIVSTEPIPDDDAGAIVDSD
jgi:hypothetical protein